MNGKRNAAEPNEILTKKARLTDELVNNDICLTYSDEVTPQCEAEPQTHGEPTFGAITYDNGSSGDECDDFGIEFFDDFECIEEQDRQPVAGPMGWIQRQIELGTDPRSILKGILPANIELPINMDIFTIWKVIFDILTDPQPRQKLSNVNTIEHTLYLLKTCKKIVILTGAGVSVSCGIPDFRSRDGIYARLSKEYLDLPDPQAMFDINYFRQNIKPFYKFAKEIYPGKFKPSLSHRFIHQVEKHGQLLRNYTQNIDTLEKQTGITQAIECHGSFSTASCTNCKYKLTADIIRDDILNQVTPLCPICPVSDDVLSVMKPDIVFFGESLPEHFHKCIETDINQVDLLIVIGSSLKVRPVALIPNQIPANVPQILINREPLPYLNFDVELLGDCDTIIAYLCQQLGGKWLDVLEGFKIPKVSNEQISKFSKTSPEYCKDTVNDENNIKEDLNVIKEDLVKKITDEKTDKCEKEKLYGEKQDRQTTEEQDLDYIFLPPCRYVFHGAELKHSKQSSEFSDESSEESSKTDTSEETDELNEDNNDQFDMNSVNNLLNETMSVQSTDRDFIN